MLTLNHEDYQKIVAHGREGKPLEICGLLVGHRNGDDATVSEIHRVDSTDPQETTYSMDGLQYMKIETDARKRDLEIVGIYHTHPATVPYPSKTDVARAHWDENRRRPDFSGVFVSHRFAARPRKSRTALV